MMLQDLTMILLYLTMILQDLTMILQDLTMILQDLTMILQDLTMILQDLTMILQDLTMILQDLTMILQDLTMILQDLTMILQDLTMILQGLTMILQDLTICRFFHMWGHLTHGYHIILILSSRTDKVTGGGVFLRKDTELGNTHPATHDLFAYSRNYYQNNLNTARMRKSLNLLQCYKKIDCVRHARLWHYTLHYTGISMLTLIAA